MIYALNGNAIDVKAYDIHGNAIDTESEHISAYNANKDIYTFQGTLHKNGLHLLKSNGERASIRGIGTHALLQYNNLHTYKCFESLRNLGFNMVRCTVYLEDYVFSKSDGIKAYGYTSKPADTKAEIEKIVNYCEQLGLYVLLDWHVYSWGAGSGTTPFHQTEAEEFFSYFSNLYKDKPFVMYELANEPHHQTIAEYIPFLQSIRTIIKENVNDPVMVTGTCKESTKSLWDSMIDYDLDDIFISPHAYDTGIDISKYQILIDYGVPIFNTEWGNCDGTGDGTRYDERSTALMAYYEQEKIPQAIWKYTDQDYVGSVLKNLGSINSPSYSDGFTESDLTVGGLLHATWFKYYS